MPDQLLKYLRRVAPDAVDVPILQPADPFLETAGEDLRRRIFLTEAQNGVLNCLRPEFTIPICLAHEGGAKRYAYGGTVFRQAREGSNEFQQVGLEDIGNSDAINADAQCLKDALDALAVINVTDVRVTIGDQNLFDVVVKNLNLPGAVAARLSRNFGNGEQVARVISALENRSENHNGFDAATSEAGQLAKMGDETALVAHIEDLMAKGGLSPHSGRGPQFIAKRMIDKTRDASFRLSAEQAQVLKDFLALDLPLASAIDDLNKFAKSAGFDFGKALSSFEARTNALGEQAIDLAPFKYRASFGRNLEYYTGLLFDIAHNGITIAGGGRYDHLCELLGHGKLVPAVGFSISLDRVAEAQA